MPGSGTAFEPGQSGNWGGKAKGTRNRTTLAMEAILEGEAETLTRKAIELACEGDTVALRLAWTASKSEQTYLMAGLSDPIR